MNPPITRVEDVTTARLLAHYFDRHLGTSPYRPNYFEGLIHKPYHGALFVAERGVGAIAAAFAIEEDVKNLSRFEFTGFKPTVKDAFILDLAVDEEVRGRGLGKKLVARACAFMADLGARRFVSSAWESPSEQRSRPVFESLEFEAQGTIENYWLEQEGEVRSGCTYHPEQCTCAATLMVLEFPPSGERPWQFR